MSNLTTTIVEQELLNSVPKKAIVQYLFDSSISGSSDSTSFIELEIPGQLINNEYYRSEPNLNLNGGASVINIISFNISCESDDYDFKILNVNDITKFDTINELLSIENVEYSYYLCSPEPLIYENNDTVQNNKLYLFIINNSSTSTGNIDVEIIYEIIKNV